ncbi:MAG TPA: allantoinase AllB [Candidatus Dormibacteraeota bacterium]|nr:allantoinase AllB [Candidatus Dormibacteraeota bacterium]
MIVRGGTVVTTRGVERADIAVDGGVIVEVEHDLDEQGEEIDAAGLHVFPGGIDSHVHFNEPGRTEWEDIGHGTAALAAGGYTAFIDMPLNNLPVTTTVAAFDLKVEAMGRSARVDYGLWGGLVPGNLDQLAPLVERGVMGFKAFMCPSGIDEFAMCDDRTLREGMKRIADLDSILLVHAEDPSLLREPQGPTVRDFLASRPPEAEIAAIDTAIAIAQETGCRLHVVHVSTTRGAELIAAAPNVSGETCPHYLLYSDDDLERLGGLGKCAPPFRAERMGLMPVVVSDHSPSTLELKQGEDLRNVWGGISGCQSTRQLLLRMDGMELSTVAAVTATNVADRFRIPRKGDIAPGFDADLWLVDLNHQDVMRRDDLLYRNQFSVHEGQKIRGRTVRTLVRGRDATAVLGLGFRPATC